MPSTVEISSQLDASVSSAINLGPLSQKIRGASRHQPAFLYIAENFDIVDQAVKRLERAVRIAPSVGRIHIESADIGDLIVGGETGPGQILVLSGPPSYAPVGWIGTQDSGVSVNITTVSGPTFNTDSPHGLEVGAIFHATGVSSIEHLGWFEVATVPTPTSLTVTTAISASGSGGEIEQVYAGAHFRSIYLGGASAAESTIYSTPQGQIRIGLNGSISIRDSLDIEKGFLGVTTEAEKNIGSVANNGSGLIRLTVTGHGYETGDDVVVNLPGLLVASGDYMIVRVDANTFDLADSVYSTGYSGGGKVYRWRGPFWGQSIAAGATGYHDATFRTARDGSLRIGIAGGPRLEIDSDGDMAITDASIHIASSAGDLTFDATQFVIETANNVTGMTAGAVTLQDKTVLAAEPDHNLSALLTPTSIGLSDVDPTDARNSQGVIYRDTDGIHIRLTDLAGDEVFHAKPSGDVQINSLVMDGLTVINSTRNASFASLNLTTTPLAISSGGTGANDPAAARTALDVYSKAEVDALIAGVGGAYASATHTHSVAVSGTTDSGGTTPHTHTFTSDTSGTSGPIG
jgi:hypothetical protein